MQMKEKTVTDSGEGGEGGVERWKQGEKQRQGTQQVLPA